MFSSAVPALLALELLRLEHHVFRIMITAFFNVSVCFINTKVCLLRYWCVYTELHLMFSLMDKVPSGIEPMLKDLEDHIMSAGLADMVASAETITTVSRDSTALCYLTDASWILYMHPVVLNNLIDPCDNTYYISKLFLIVFFRTLKSMLSSF